MKKLDKKMKKGAMFGLDARIALAIFGALSVISGAALYSAIQNSKVTSFVAQHAEHAKAFESYYIDTGEFVARDAGVLMQQFDIDSLYVNPSLNGWKGPYLSVNYENDGSNVFYPLNGYTARYELYETGTWGLEISNGDLNCNPGDECSVWIITYAVERLFADLVDALVDGDLSPTTGNYRIWGTGTSVNTMYKVMSYKGN